MECKNNFCLWNFNNQCCPESGEQYKNAKPNELDCPSSIRKDFDSQLFNIADECKMLLNKRNMRELKEIKRFIEGQRG